MDVNFFCEEENCISDASAFYFKAGEKRKVCVAHLPTYGEKYPIEHFYFVKSPEDETELLRRIEEVRQGKGSLEKLHSLADDELTVALELLEKKKVRAVQVINEMYEAEKKRTRQHHHQLEVSLQDMSQELDLYLLKKETRLSNSLDILTTTELSAPSLLQVRSMEIDVELARIVINSCSRGERSFDCHLSDLLSPKPRAQTADQLFQLAQKSSQTDSYIELQQALANCTESEALNQLPEVTQLKTFLKGRLDGMKAMRENELLGLVTRDSESIRSLLDVYLNNISTQKAAGDAIQVEKLYEKALSFVLPESQSKATLDTLLSFAQWRTVQEQEKTRELKKALKAALKILMAYYPNAKETMNTSLQLGKLYQSEGKYNAALQHCQKAVDIGKANFAKLKETAEALAYLEPSAIRLQIPNAIIKKRLLFSILNSQNQARELLSLPSWEYSTER